MKKTISILMAFVILLTSIASFSIVANASFENKKYKDFVFAMMTTMRSYFQIHR